MRQAANPALRSARSLPIPEPCVRLGCPTDQNTAAGTGPPRKESVPMMSRAARLLFLCAAIVLPAATHAVSILMPREPDLPPLEMKSEIIAVAIDGPVARTHLTQVFHNPHPRVLEGTFLVTLPKGAQVTDFVLTMNGEKVHGDVLESGEARQIYTDIVRKMRDPGLLEYVDAQTLKFRIFPIPANGDMPVELEFAQPLERKGDLYSFELASSGRWQSAPADETDLSLQLDWPGGIGVLYSPSHKIEESKKGDGTRVVVPGYSSGEGRPFQLLLAPADKDLALHLIAYQPDTSGDGTFMLMIHPPREGALAKALPKTVTFVLDVSGSMNENGKIEQARVALRQCLGALAPEDHFNIMTFSTGVESFRRAPVPASKEELAAAREFVEGFRAHGGTNIDEALKRAVSQETAGRIHQVLFLTDGLPTVGVTDKELILSHLRDANQDALRVFAFGVGYDVNTHLLDAIAEDTRALSEYVGPEEDLEVKVSTLFDSIAHPVLSDLALDINGVEIRDLFPIDLPDLFLGQDLLVFGRYRGHGTATALLKGNAGDKEYTHEATLRFPETTDGDARYVAALWANRKVGYLLDEIRRNGETRELREEVLELALEYNLVTPYTSFLVVEDAELERDNIVRSRFSQTQDYDPMAGTVSQGDVYRVKEGTSPQLSNMPPVVITDRVAQRRAGRSGIVGSFGTKASAPGTLQEQTGEKSVQFSRDLRVMKGAETLSAASSESTASVRRIDGETFAFDGERWRQEMQTDDQAKTLKVKYLSDAYFALIDRFPGKTKAITLGEQVTLKLGGYVVEIGAEGVAKADGLPEDLKP
ncbi:MAG: Ca-activated chloride channel [Candidatus Sumerlaeota bacterium]|nr:Ca-activated chloride channel [Candidatus Sumerlaeota bacterium]